MSQNYPYRRQPPLAPNKESQQNHGAYSSSDQRVQRDYQFYRQTSSQFSTSYPLPSSSKTSVDPSYSVPRADSTLSLLSSCGLEPSDLSVLAELPEDVLTLDALPHLLTEIKGKKGMTKPSSASPAPSSFSSSVTSHPKTGTIRPYPPSPAPSSISSSMSLQAPFSSRVSAASKWEDIRNQPVQYPLDHAFITHKPLPPEQVQDWQDRWGNPRQTGSVSANSPSSADVLASLSSSGYLVDYDHKDGCAEFGKKGRGDRPRYENPPRSSTPVGGSIRKPPRSFAQPGSADYRVAQPPDRYQAKPRVVHRPQNASYRNNDNNSSSSSSKNTGDKVPCRKAAQDFHGTTPEVFPYTCSLCDITCLSEKVWIQHLNGSLHAVAQLNLLNLFPEWDCRIESCRDDDQSEKPKEKERPAQPLQTTYPQPNIKRGKKPTANGKVICAKFPAQSVDEEYLRKLCEPFGKIVKVLMFPSLAFVELGSCDQAKDLVNYYTSNPQCVNGQEITFYISSTFNFLQSSRVVSFIPAPVGDDGFSDLINIAKRFGVPVYTLFLPSMAFIEMAITADAQKLVDYYLSNTLKINGVVIKVAFSGEYNTLMRLAAAKKYEEEPSGIKRRRSPTPPRRRDEPERFENRQRDKDGERGRSKERARKRSSGSLSSERSSQSRRSQSTEGGSRRESLASDQTQQIKTESKMEIATLSKSPEPQTSQTSQTAATKVQTMSSGEDSDIEGMEVIGEDGEYVDDDAMEVLDEEGEEGAEEKNDTQGLNPPESSSALEPGFPGGPREDAGRLRVKREMVEEEVTPQTEPVCVSEPQTDAETLQDQKTEPVDKDEDKDFPADMENLITLDELSEDECDSEEDKNKSKTKMLTSSEAEEVVPELRSKSPEFSVQLSHKYDRVAAGWMVQSDKERSRRREEDRSLTTSCKDEETTEQHENQTQEKPDKHPVGRGEAPGESLRTENPPDQLTPSEDKQIKPGQKEEEYEGAEQDHQKEVENNKKEDCSSTNQPQCGPVQDVVEPALPIKPVGIEFVRPVVGYFCNLCKVIYADEDEAKTEHCKSIAHYQKYQELTGKDPWGS